MALECPKCKSPVARDGQRFCYRCGHDLGAYYESMKAKSGQSGAVAVDGVTEDKVRDPWGAIRKSEDSPRPQLPAGTVILEPNAFDGEKTPVALPKANLKILLPTGDVFDREISDEETQ